MVLGTVLFQRSAGPVAIDNLPISLEVVFEYSVFHWLAFTVMGGVGTFVLTLVGKDLAVPAGVLLMFALFVAFEFGLRVVGAVLFSQDIQQVVPAVSACE